jgi:hypothetical protein
MHATPWWKYNLTGSVEAKVKTSELLLEKDLGDMYANVLKLNAPAKACFACAVLCDDAYSLSAAINKPNLLGTLF